MKKKIRLIARLDINNDFVIKGKYFEGLRKVGNPEILAKKYYEDGVDEILFLDAVASLYDRNSLFNIVEKISKQVFVPITVGGGIRSIKDINKILKSGADKVAINSQAFKNEFFLKEAVKIFGSSTIVASITVMKEDNGWSIYIDNAKHKVDNDLFETIKKFESYGVGELMINSKDRDGIMNGFDCDLIKFISKNVRMPVIASSGAGNINHIERLVKETNCDAVSIASLLHYNKSTIKNIKNKLKNKKIQVRFD